ncbi:MAG: HpaII family restriction endonuclease [Crocinitomicaceae bacterium]|nr:HpaII family restriction endonuclease [Crocinitomicaceae bacterium]
MSKINPTNFGQPTSSFIHLKAKVFAEYKFLYHINNGCKIERLSDFTHKHQLLFKKMSDHTAQKNLMMVDSIFPIIMADVVLGVFLKMFSSFAEYSNSKNHTIIVDREFQKEYLNYKFTHFIEHLLYSNISSSEPFKGSVIFDKVYYLKNEQNEIKYYSVYDKLELQNLLFEELKLEVDFERSTINDDEVGIWFRFFFK